MRRNIYVLLLDYSDIFAQSPDDFGRTGKIQHRIDTGNSTTNPSAVPENADFRKDKAGKLVRKDANPLPRVDETLDTLAGSKWFSTLDLISGYWQVEVSPEDREETRFHYSKWLIRVQSDALWVV